MLFPTRRQFVSITAGAAAVALNARTPETQEGFEFIFFTDTHLQPELNAAKGCGMAFHKARRIKADFAIQGGDHVFDAENVTKERAISIFDLYDKTEQDLGLKVYHTCGNHDCFGIASKGKIAQSDRNYGKKMFEEHFGRAHYSFDHKGVHFLVLDSIRPLPNGSGFIGHIDHEQLAWIAADLAQLPSTTPVIVSVHVPLVTAFESYVKLPPDHKSIRGLVSVDNSDSVIKIFDQHNVIGVLQGHTHIWEQVTWHGVPYVTGGAVSGNWWKGTHLGTAEGFTVVRVKDGTTSARYQTYGFKSIDPHND